MKHIHPRFVGRVKHSRDKGGYGVGAGDVDVDAAAHVRVTTHARGRVVEWCDGEWEEGFDGDGDWGAPKEARRRPED
jgi:hypothetical protein